jgi:hypothetical protein
MKKVKITLEIESYRKNERRISKFDKLVNAFVQLWKATLTSSLRSSAKNKLLRQIVVSSTLIALSYLLVCILPILLNRP